LLLSALRRAVAEGLSGEQRTVFTAVTLHGVPAAALAAAPGSNRNAIYKALFEARRILRARLAANRRDLAYLPGAPGPVRPGWMICSALTRGIRGCDLAFHVLDRYAEADSTERARTTGFPGLAAHLRRCEACHHDYQGCWPR